MYSPLCAIFGKNKLTGSCQVKDYDVIKEQGQTIFLQEMAEYDRLEGDTDHNEASFDHFRSELTCLTRHNALSPCGQGQAKVKVRSAVT